jgi:predicted transcriptional regulator
LKKTATITVRCTEDMRAKLATLARADRRTISSLVEILLEQALQRIEKSSKKRITPERQSR